MELPTFKYHPDPIGTGSIVKSDIECVCCEQKRGYVYVGPVYAEEELHESLCPWCIADGAAHKKFSAEFVDIEAVGDYGSWVPVSRDILNEVVFRTPGFTGWQQERWWTHCADAAEFLGYIGASEAKALGEAFLKVIRDEAGMKSDDEWRNYLEALDKNHGPTAYAFRCRWCGRLGGYSDCH